MNKLFLTLMSFVTTSAFAAAPNLAKSMSIETKPESTTEFLATGHPGFLQITGKGAHPSGQFQLQTKASPYQFTGQVSVKMEEFDTGIDKRSEHMKKKYLEVEKYPTSTLSITEMNLEKPFSQKMTGVVPFKGKLTLHGIEKGVSGTANYKIDKNIAEADAKFSILITDFKIDVPVFLGITVASKVDITAHIVGNIQEKK